MRVFASRVLDQFDAVTGADDLDIRLLLDHLVEKRLHAGAVHDKDIGPGSSFMSSVVML